jgi:DNA end-binding protein Ku
MAQSVWRGQLTFALVSFPVRLYPAARARRIKFRRMVRAEAAAPARKAAPVLIREEPEPPPLLPAQTRLVPEGRSTPVEPERVVRAFEIDKNTFVPVEEPEIRALDVETSTELRINEFVKLAEVDPIYYETSYYLKPDEPGERPYALLLEAMRKTRFVALGEIAMHRREHIVILRPGNTGIIVHTMFYQDEVNAGQEFRAVHKTPPAKRELELSTRLIETMVARFEPEKYRDARTARLQELIDSKPAAPASARKPPAPAVDILAALERSLARRA